MSVDAAAEEQFGPYLVYERLGVGGMATVHRALEQGAEGFERTVALKRLLPHLAEDASFIKSFVREAKLASILNHVNIVQIYELGRVGTEYFISMEYIDGRDLRRILRHARKVTGPPPVHITVGLMLQLCEALDYAHNKVDEDGHPLGLVHRDISPSNLLVTSGGNLKIIDFGIAKAQSSQLRTHTGRVKGKLAYMAPEAVSGTRELDARSDIWACGVILHELLTARPLFASKNEYQTLLKVQRGDIMPPSTFNQGCPPELDAIVFRALARDPDHRFANASELREALIALKKQHALQTGFRDISGWLDWAFGLETPPSFSQNPDSSGVHSEPKMSRQKTPRPARITEEEEAVEIVWGGGEVESEDGPVVLEDVPDVSEKHQRPRRVTEEGSYDDIPTPLPSHGTMPTIYGADAVEAVPASPSQPIARGSDQLPRKRASTSAPHIIQRDPSGAIPRRTGAMPALDTPQLGERMAAQRARTESGEHTNPDPKRARTESGVRARTDSGSHTKVDPHRARTEPGRASLPAELFAAEAASSQAQVSDDAATPAKGMPQVAQATDDEPTLSQTRKERELPLPVVRFSPTAPPPLAAPEPIRSEVSTKQGIAPVRAMTAPRAQSPSRAPATVRIGESIAARAVQPRRMWPLVLGGVVLAGVAATTIAIIVSGGASTSKQREAPAAQVPVRETGTVRFVTEPADAEIKIAGKNAHAGSPWSTELAAGIHQIEIHRAGYKSWLTSLELSANETSTLRVVLEPLTSKVADASLTIATTPSGLEVVIDGQVQAKRTPFETTLKPGVHEISVRQNGVDVWRQTLDAEPSSDYEFNPSFTADKQRERAQRTPKATPETAPVPAPTPDSPQPTEPPTTAPAIAAPSAAPSINPVAVAPPPTVAPPAPPPSTVATTSPPAPTTTPSPAAAPKQTPLPPAPKTAPPPPTPKQQVVTPAAPIAPAASRTPPRIVPPVAVKKLSGDQPSIAKFKNVQLPASLAAKVCIDEAGKVTSANMMTKIEPRIASDLTDELLDWRYAPYKQGSAAIPVCFVVTFRAK
jgi:serine/threonine protein kinase